MKNTITMGNDEFILYIRKNYNCSLTNDRIGKLVWSWILNNSKEIDKTKMDSHHIYPKSRVKDFNLKSPFNSIANIILVDSSTNREEFKDKSPEEYFSEIKKQSNGNSFCDKNLINIDEASKINSEEDAMMFIENRADQIAQIVNSYFD